MEIQKWEYRLWKGHATAAYDENSIILEDASGHAAEMDPVFDEWGQMGWELVEAAGVGLGGNRGPPGGTGGAPGAAKMRQKANLV